ncbi:glycosyltransferase family 61 protein [Paenibacillus ginsengarvi]|uniref:Glycosyltransferase family 61 protein n=1 Tax=Paenibacillus ginsengarvi TaxID=400777 RepID=A0A3B0CMZ4_9BACL|nr:glycosyltransferase family 61 protein [Paenibacillus ginsengarvi]RKN85336.1 glycosyltransferase family 61 protein [Paenibacillus ginsengarvi]
MSVALPAGTYSTLRDWSLAQRGNASHYEVYGAQPLQMAEPHTVDSELHPVFRQRSAAIPEGYVAVLPEGRYYGGEDFSGAVITPDNRLVWDVSTNFIIPNWVHPIYRCGSLPPLVRTAETVAVLTFIWSRNYFHWVIDVLGRLALLQKSGIPIDKYIISGDGPAAFQEETLTLLGIPPQRIIRSYNGLHLQAERLVVPSLQPYNLLPFKSNQVPRWATDFVRSELYRIVRPQPLSGFERIYISRKDANHRKVLNEGDVIRMLMSRGFREVTLAGKTVAEQIRLFRSAQIIIAPHGASLTNLIFCQTGARVLDILPTRYMYPCFWHISSYYGLSYAYLIAQGMRLAENEGIGKVGYVHDDISVDIGALTVMLTRMGV